MILEIFRIPLNIDKAIINNLSARESRVADIMKSKVMSIYVEVEKKFLHLLPIVFNLKQKYLGRAWFTDVNQI